MISLTDIRAYNQAIDYFKSKAEKDDILAIRTLGVLYWKGASGREDNVKAAFPYWKKAAEGGDLQAALLVGTTLLDGSASAYNQAGGFACLLKAAETGNADIQFMLGYCCKKGIGCIRNKQLAEKYYRLASLQNHEKAQWELGYMLAEADSNEGLYWICRSHRNGFSVATKFLNDMVEINPQVKKSIDFVIDHMGEEDAVSWE